MSKPHKISIKKRSFSGYHSRGERRAYVLWSHVPKRYFVPPHFRKARGKGENTIVMWERGGLTLLFYM